MDIDKTFQDQLIKITQEAAISVFPHLGKNNKIIADEAATNSMRTNLNKMNIRGNIVIGEGEMDEAPMLHIGEKVGTKKGPEFDIAVDPLEGTKFTANGEPNAFSVLAISEKQIIMQVSDKMLKKRLRAKPHFQEFLAALILVDNHAAWALASVHMGTRWPRGGGRGTLGLGGRHPSRHRAMP